jgi:uncharacterized coiled-coil protein SlyX
MDKPTMTAEEIVPTFDGPVTTETRMNRLETRMNRLETRMNSLERTVEGLVTTVEGLVKTVQGLETRMKSLETTVQGLVTRMDAFETAHTIERTAVGECCVCMETMADESYRPYLVTPGCGNRKHLFHLQCGHNLISRHIPCPLCRTPIQTLFKMWVRRPHPTPGVKTL